MNTEFRFLDAETVVTGHVSRDGRFVDVRQTTCRLYAVDAMSMRPSVTLEYRPAKGVFTTGCLSYFDSISILIAHSVTGVEWHGERDVTVTLLPQRAKMPNGKWEEFAGLARTFRLNNESASYYDALAIDFPRPVEMQAEADARKAARKAADRARGLAEDAARDAAKAAASEWIATVMADPRESAVGHDIARFLRTGGNRNREQVKDATEAVASSLGHNDWKGFFMIALQDAAEAGR